MTNNSSFESPMPYLFTIILKDSIVVLLTCVILIKEKTFKCEICPLSFTQKSYYDKHIELVHEGKTFKWEICLSNYTQKGNLIKDIKSIHEGRS